MTLLEHRKIDLKNISELISFSRYEEEKNCFTIRIFLFLVILML